MKNILGCEGQSMNEEILLKLNVKLIHKKLVLIQR
jgi:hypothetical protein